MVGELERTGRGDDGVDPPIRVHHPPEGLLDGELGRDITADPDDAVVVRVHFTVNFTPYQCCTDRIERRMLTACCFDELLCCLLCFVFLQVDNGERGAARLHERSAELEPKPARCAGDHRDLQVRVRASGRIGTTRVKGWRTLLAMEKSGRVLTTRALAATSLLNLAMTSERAGVRTRGRAAARARERTRETMVGGREEVGYLRRRLG